jgi:hypothetical protein
MAGVKGRSGRWRKLDETMLADVRKLSLREGLRFLKDKEISPEKKAPYVFGVVSKLIPERQEIRRININLTQEMIDGIVGRLESLPIYDNSSKPYDKIAINNTPAIEVTELNVNDSNDLQE